MVYQHGDEARSCDALGTELEMIEDEILDLVPQTDKTTKNVSLGVAGMFLLVPFFFMDLSKAEEIEIKALTKRYNHLLEIAETKGCILGREPISELE